MKIGIIAPTRLLARYCRTDIQYCIPSLLVDEDSYRHFYTKRASMGNTLILDCVKIGWKREPEDFDTVKRALKYLEPNWVVAPSYMFNLKWTLKVQEDFKEAFSTLCPKTLGCIEGASGGDAACFPIEDRLAAPSHMYRYLRKLKLNSHTLYIDNHLNLDELQGKEGILVTSLPIRLGLQGRLLSDYKPAPPALTFEEEDMYPKIMERNVAETIEYYEE